MSTKSWYYADDPAIFADPFFKEFNFLFKNMRQNEAEFKPFFSTMKMPYPLNVWKNDEFVAIEIPIIRGKSEDIEITRTSDSLRVQYTRSDKSQDEGKTFVSRGIVERDFDFSWKIPPKIDYAGIQSVYENGLLSIYLPIAKEAKPEKVQVLATGENWKQLAETGKLKQEAFQE